MLNSLKGLSPKNLPLAQYLSTPAGTRLLRQVLVVLGTLALAYFLGQAPSLTYVYVPVALVAVWGIFAYPELGLVALVTAALVIPFQIGTNTNSPLNVAFLAVPALGFLWLIDMARNRSIQLAPSSTTLPLIGLVVTISLSFLVGYLPWNVFAQLAPVRAELGAWGIFVLSALAFLLGANRLGQHRLAQAAGLELSGAGRSLHSWPPDWALRPCYPPVLHSLRHGQLVLDLARRSGGRASVVQSGSGAAVAVWAYRAGCADDDSCHDG